MLRRLVEHFSRNRILRRRLPHDLSGARIYVSPDSSLRFWLPGTLHVDPLLFDLVRDFIPKGARVWDVGANVGLFSFAAASRADSVLAIEPDPFLASLLMRSAAGNDRLNVLTAAIGDQCGIEQLQIAARGRASNFISVGRGEAGGSRCKVSVATVTLDSLLHSYPRPTHIKLDIEGGEGRALYGARTLLQSAKPVVLAEVAEFNKQMVAEILRGAGYQFMMTNGKLAEGVPNNLIATPRPS